MAQSDNLECESSARSEPQHEVEHGNNDSTHGHRVSSLGAKAQGSREGVVFTRDNRSFRGACRAAGTAILAWADCHAHVTGHQE